MQERAAFIAAGVAAAMLVASVASADAAPWGRHSYRSGPGPVLGLFGDVVAGAATIATAPFAIIAGAARPAPPPAYYGPPRGYYAPPPRAYAPPPPRYYDPPPAY